MIYDVLIIGGGPAGMTAGIYAKRAGMNVAFLEKGAPGGQVVNTYEVENYPGFTNINGAELATHMFNHTQELGVTYLYGEVIEVNMNEQVKEVRTLDGQVYMAYSIIVATGTQNDCLNVPGEDRFKNRGISWCAICDGAFYKEKTVAVIGGGNSALEEGLYLAGIASKVYIIHRRDEFRADKKAQDRVKSHPNIELVLNKTVEEFLGDSLSMTGIRVRDTKTNEESMISVDGAFEYVGQSPNTKFLASHNVTDEKGFIITNHDMETAIPGLFACGDVIVKHLRQIATAVSDGAIAGQKASAFADENKN